MNNNLKLLAVAGSALAIVACQGTSSSNASANQQRLRVADAAAAQAQPFTCPVLWQRAEPRPPECPEIALRVA